MPIFHFDIADRVRLEDPVGLDCKNEHDARKTADLIARQIAASKIPDAIMVPMSGRRFQGSVESLKFHQSRVASAALE
jgi:hypothetical protein